MSTNDSQAVDVSVVLPVYEEEKAIGKVLDELIQVLQQMKIRYEIIAVNRSGNDNSYKILKDYSTRYKNLYPVNIRYLRTSGMQKGLQYALGFKLSSGKYVVQMDSDHQDDPKDIPLLLQKLDDGYDLVVGWRKTRKENSFYSATSWCQNWLTRLVTGLAIHDKNCGLKAYSSAAAKSLRLHGLNFRDIPIQLHSMGFKVTEIEINNRERLGGKQKFNFKSRLMGGTVDFLCNVIISGMGDMPFRFWGTIGLVSLLGASSFFVFFFFWLCWEGYLFGLNWWIVYWFIFDLILWILGIGCLSVGILAEYVVDQEGFDLGKYYIDDDCKGIIDKKLG